MQALIQTTDSPATCHEVVQLLRMRFRPHGNLKAMPVRPGQPLVRRSALKVSRLTSTDTGAI
jgi:hypothetical protein